MSPDEYYKRLGIAIRTRRRESLIPQEVLAEKIGVSRPSLANIEAGRQRVYAHLIEPIAAAIGTTVEALLTPPSAAELRRVELLEREAKVALERDRMDKQLKKLAAKEAELAAERAALAKETPCT